MRRFTEKEDRYLCAYECVAVPLLAEDLGRPVASVAKRLKMLRDAGCVALYHQAHDATVRFDVAAGHMTAENAELVHGVKVHERPDHRELRVVR